MEDEYGGQANLFTESELAAAELLVQLSESVSGCSCRELYHRDQSSSSTTSSPRSVNTLLKLNPMAVGVDDCNDDAEDEMAVALPTRKKRYRMLADVYESTACIFVGGGAEEKQNDSKRRRKTWKRNGNGNGNVVIAV